MRLWIFVLALFCSLTVWSANPEITEVTGLVSGWAEDTTANVLTITGLNFSTKSPAAPRIWATWENGTSSATPLGQDQQWFEKLNLTSTDIAHVKYSSWSLYSTWQNPPNSYDWTIYVATITEFYQWQERFSGFTWTANQKFFRFRPSSGANNFVCSTAGGGTCFNECNSAQWDKDVNFPEVTTGTQITEQFFWSHRLQTTITTPGDFGDGLFEYYRDGFQLFGSTSQANCEIRLVEPVGPMNSTSGDFHPDPGSTMYVDTLYMDDTWAKVHISTVSNDCYAGKKLSPQPAKSWSDTQIEFHFHQHVFDTGDLIYLYVMVSGTRECNANGFPLTVGENRTGRAGIVPRGNLSIRGNAQLR